MSELITLARPYAKAAFEFAKGESAVDQWSQDLLVAAGLAQTEEILNYFGRPDVLEDDLVRLVSGENSTQHYQNFVRLLAQNDRLSLLPEVARVVSILPGTGFAVADCGRVLSRRTDRRPKTGHDRSFEPTHWQTDQLANAHRCGHDGRRQNPLRRPGDRWLIARQSGSLEDTTF